MTELYLLQFGIWTKSSWWSVSVQSEYWLKKAHSTLSAWDLTSSEVAGILVLETV